MKFLDLLLHGAGRVTGCAGSGSGKRRDDARGETEHDRKVLEARRAAQYELLGFLDEVCRDNGIGYFIFSETLQGAVNYHDFVPGASDIQLGMEREDYDRFARTVGPIAGQRGYRFEPTCGWFGNVPRPLPVLCKEVEPLPEPGAQPGLMRDGSPSASFACLEISIFDALPDSFDVRKGHLRRMRRLNLRTQWITDARAVLLGQLPVEDAGHLWRVVRNLPRFRAHCARRLMKQAQRYNGRGMAQVTRLAGSRIAFVDRAALAPYDRIAFGPLTVNCPSDPSVWAVDVAAQDPESIRPLQEGVKRILVEVDRVCRELGIGYFICGGTMLGWKRHGGYIPWDDDMDIGMLRADYDEFRARAGALLGEEYFLQTRESDPFIPYLFTKVRLEGTEYITAYNERRPFHKGLCLDIFPFDAIPDDEAAQERFQEKVVKRARLHHRVVSRQIVEPDYDTPARGLEERWFRLFGRVHRWVFWHIPLPWTQAWYISLATKYNARAEVDRLTSVASFVPSYTHIRLDDLLPYRDVQFEDIVVMVPQHPEVFLEMQYGDYMKWPPLHERVGHALLRWSDIDREHANPTTDM